MVWRIEAFVGAAPASATTPAPEPVSADAFGEESGEVGAAPIIEIRCGGVHDAIVFEVVE